MKLISEYFKTFTLLIILTLTIFCNSNQAAAKPGDNYSAEQAIKYADSCFQKKGNSYVKVPNKIYGDDLCAGYVSQCLREGGMETDKKWYWNSKNDTSESWRVCSSLHSYLKDCGYKINYSPTASDVNPGDIVFYYRNGRWGHVAICTGKTSDGTPYVNAYNNPHYHLTYWTMGYKACVVSMESCTSAPKITEKITSSGKKITISSDTPNSTIYYTKNGNIPTTSSTKYTKSFTVKKDCTINAIAVHDNYKPSEVVSKTIEVNKTITDGIYYITSSENNKLALGIQSSSKDDLAKAGLMEADSEEYNRKFKITYDGNGKYQFTALHSDMVLSEAYTSDDTDQTNFICQTNDKAASNKWLLKPAGDNKYYLQNFDTNNYLSVSSVKDGTTAVVSNKQQQTGQLWSFTKATTSDMKLTIYEYPKTIKSGTSHISLNGFISSNYDILSVKLSILNAETNKTIYSVSSKDNSKNVYLYALGHKFNVKNLSSGKYKLKITAYDCSKQTKTLFNKQFTIN